MPFIAYKCGLHDERYVIMDSIIKYILQITAAAVLCAFVKTILPDSNTSGKMLRIITGIFLILTVLSPVLKFRLEGIDDFLSDFSVSADSVTADGQKMAGNAMASIIKSNTETYILSEARKLRLQIDVEVMTDQSNPPVPCAVIIKGNVSPYNRNELKGIIGRQLGISEENIQWIPVT